MDSAFNRRIEMMKAEGFDPVALHEALQRHRARRAWLGLMGIGVMMLGLAAIGFTTLPEDAELRAGVELPGGESGAAAEPGLDPSGLSAGAPGLR